MENNTENNNIFPHGSLKIIYLDTEEQDLAVIQQLLLHENRMQLVCVSKVEEFRQKLDKEKFNCIILAYQIPGVNIFEMVYELVETSPQRPIIIVSKVLDSKLTASFQQFPFLKFVSKEYISREVLEKVIIELIHASQVKMEKSSQQGGILGFENKLLKQEFYVDVIDTMDEGLVTIDMDGVILFVNNTVLRMLGYTRKDMLGYNVSKIVPENQKEYFCSQFKSVLAGKPKLSFELELKGKNEMIVPVLIHNVQMRNEKDEIIGSFFTFADLSDIKYKEARLMETNIMLERQSRLDNLTELLNYRSLRECIDLEFIKARAENKTLIIIVVDIDYFKILNNNSGHNFGDFVLKKIGEIIKEEITENDIIGRHQADQFTVVLINSDYEKASDVAERLRKRVAEHLFQDKENSSRVTISVGIASLKDDGAKSVQELLNFSDLAIRQAKIKGRNTVVAYIDLKGKMESELLQREEDKISVIEKQLVNLADSSKKSYMEAAKALIAALEAKDPYTKAHSLNVATFATMIAEELGLSEQQIELISDAAQLHDIGKIGIPENILLKNGRLTKEEYEVVKQHPLISIQILKRIKYMESELPIIQCHHERPDGKGYPAGLLLIDIPLGAQIISVADSYDAMISLRPYRGALKVSEAVNELKNNAGSQFNPEVVIAFLNALIKKTKAEEKDHISKCIEELKTKFNLGN